MTSHTSTDTIAALATPPGRGGIAIVRISGPKVQEMMLPLFGCKLKAREASFLAFRDHENVIDQGIAIFFPNPNSFTGEDVLELHGHGGPVVVDLLLQKVLQLGARLARPGEFSERAFLNGKMDLTQAEAIADLIDASSKQAARLAMRSLQGEFSKEIHRLNDKIIYLRTFIEAAIDFSDEEIDFLNQEKIDTHLKEVINLLTDILNNAKQGHFLREGITAVIAGEPNVGKSSLLNSLSGKETAIVTNIPGTTRDVLRDYILIDGMPMHIIDTAGLRESEDIVEQEGIRRAYQEFEKADVILYVTDASEAKNAMQWSLPTHNLIHIRNKIDLTRESPSLQKNERITISLSAKSGLGIELLKNHIKESIGFREEREGIFLARRRHLDALQRAKWHVEHSLMQLTSSRLSELAAEDLRFAQQALNEITGEFTADDLLGQIFSNFCIGK